MRRALWLVPACVMFLATTAEASPIVVSAGQTVTFNFDFVTAGVTPAPPYGAIEVLTGVDQSTYQFGFDDGSWSLFGQLNGAGGAVLTAGGAATISMFANIASLLDGVFSASLTMTLGAVTVDPSAYGGTIVPRVPFGLDFVASTAAVAPLQTPAAVPEPATLTLLGSGLAAAAWRRRQRRAA